MPKLMCHLKPKSIGICNNIKCYTCQTYLEGTFGSRHFACNFTRDKCWTRNNLKSGIKYDKENK